VGKINHDLRGMLATARLVADRLAASDDPEVRKAAPALVRSLDRAVDLCSDTLNFTREGPARPQPETLELATLIGEVGDSLAKHLNNGRQWVADLPPGCSLVADRGQLFRVLRNLGENALQMGANRIRIAARGTNGRIEIIVADDGPGLPPKAMENLFVPFKGSARAGGTGLGLAIARELIRVQGGDLRLERSDAKGTVFVLDLPNGQAA
jgi:signal transduction histidine kinase